MSYLWIGDRYVLPSFIPFMLAVNFFMVGMQNGFWTFKGAYGFFREGKYMVLGTAGINLILSYFMGKEYGIAGVITATAIARLLTNFWYDPYIVLRKGLKQNPLRYLYRFSTYILVLMISSVSVYFIFRMTDLQIWLQIILKIIVISIITLISLFVVLGRSSEFKNSILFLKRIPVIKKVFK